MTSIILSSGAVPLLVGSLCLLYYCYRRILCTPIPGIPYNKDAAYTLMGDVPQIVKKYNEEKTLFPWLINHTVKYNSPIVQIFARPFSRPWIVIADPRESTDILLRRTKEFDRSPVTGNIFTGLAPQFHITLKSDDPEFKFHKNLLKDLMTPAFLNQVAAKQVHASALNLVKLWSLKAQLADGRPFDASEDVYNIHLDSITAVTFGLDTNQSATASRARHLSDTYLMTVSPGPHAAAEFDSPDRPPTYQALVTLMGSLAGIVQSPAPTLQHWLNRQSRSYKKANKIKEDMINSELDKGAARVRQGDITQKCALDNVLQRELTAAEKAQREPNYRTRAVSDELFGFLLGGYDTTASTMSWGWKHISANQHAQTTLRQHLRDAFPDAVAEGRSPTADEITKAQIPYLDATIEEIHRTARIFSMSFRRAIVDTEIMGSPIKKGTDVGLCAIGPGYTSPPIPIQDHLRSSSSQNAKYQVGEWDHNEYEVFRPEHWLREDEEGNTVFDSTSGPHLAFSLGPRGCFGRRLAYLQMRILITMVLWNLELQTVEGELGSFKAVETLARVPVYNYLQLKEIQPKA